MASPYQQQAFQRKLIYLGCILALFTGAWGFRQYVLADKARDLGVREVNRGDVELSGLLVRLTLTGSRGLATCVLWMTAIDEQKKNQWTELERDAGMLTQMQPHFITPWIFQSWNLSYNVSVSLDRSADKYFYIGRGIELLGKGERQNRYNPVMRWTIGFTYQMKICQHDETNVLRSMWQLSCIPPNKRDPNRLREIGPNGRTQINQKEFAAFCKENPQLIRRLNSGIQHDTINYGATPFICHTPEEVAKFLEDNYKILSPYETPPMAPLGGWVAKEDRLKDEEVRFPLLPPAVTPGRDPRPGPAFDQEGLNSSNTLGDGDDAYTIARAWYGYSMEPVPPPGSLPGENTDPKDRIRQRVPSNMMTSIFRQYPARAASYQAERLQQEGWFDDEPWLIRGWFKNDKFPKEDNEEAQDAKVVVKNGRLSGDAWKSAYTMWRRHGEENHMLFATAEDEENMKKRAEKFQSAYKLSDSAMPPNLRKEDVSEEVWEQYNAFRYMRALNQHLHVTNFRHHYQRARVEQEAETVQARKAFYKADTLRLKGFSPQAIQTYEQPYAMAAWRKILLKDGNEEFRNDMFIQEDTAEIQLKYLDLVEKDVLIPQAKMATSRPWFFPIPVRITSNMSLRSFIKSPFLDDKGAPIVTAQSLTTVEQRRAKPGQQKPASPPVEATPPPPK